MQQLLLTAEFFRTDKKCQTGLTRWCRACCRAYENAWIEKNREHRNALRRAWREANPAKVKAARKRYYQLYKDKEYESLKIWRARNPDWVRAYAAAHHAANREHLNAAGRERRAKKRELYGGGPARIPVKEAARRMDVTVRTVYSLLSRGKLTRIQGPGKSILVLAAEAAAAEESSLPKNVPTEILSFTTHEDCEVFTRDFGTVLDVEDLIPGAEYTLEVSSPGLERKLSRPADFTRFTGSLIKVQTFSAVNANRHFQGRLTTFDGQNLTLDLAAVKQKGKPKKAAGIKAAADQTIQIAFSSIEKAKTLGELVLY